MPSYGHHHQVLSLLDGNKGSSVLQIRQLIRKHETTCMILDTLVVLVCWINIDIVSLDLYVEQVCLINNVIVYLDCCTRLYIFCVIVYRE
jgi:hypothetical protein